MINCKSAYYSAGFVTDEARNPPRRESLNVDACAPSSSRGRCENCVSDSRLLAICSRENFPGAATSVSFSSARNIRHVLTATRGPSSSRKQRAARSLARRLAGSPSDVPTRRYFRYSIAGVYTPRFHKPNTRTPAHSTSRPRACRNELYGAIPVSARPSLSPYVDTPRGAHCFLARKMLYCAPGGRVNH